MKRLSHYTGPFDTEAELVERLLREWTPRSYSLTEKEHEDDLRVWLQTKLPDIPIVAQYGIAKGRADLVIQDSQVIELKLGLLRLA